MCGISGVFSREQVDVNAIEKMTDALSHRGPDARGLFCSTAGTIAVGHTRLSIIDLSTEANQPFYSLNNRYAVVFNGEIYNYLALKKELTQQFGVSFRTTSDTEVIAEGFSVYGIKLVEKLEGMFSIGIVDQHQNKLFLLRDRLGKKPLFYYRSENLFAFASEIKSLLRHPAVRQNKKVNRAVIPTFLHLGYIPEPHTIYENIYKFPAGHIGEIDENLSFKKSQYWKLASQLELPKINSVSQAMVALKHHLSEAVEKRTVADVPIGTFLSGGTDSSLITAYSARFVSSKIRTFSIGFAENSHDESSYARQVASCLKTDHTEHILSEKEACESVQLYLQHFDEPFADTSAIPTMLVSKLAREKVKVALTGDGGDELFQGYGTYAWANRLNALHWKVTKPFLAFALKTFGNNRLKRVAGLLDTVSKPHLRSHIFSQEQYFFSRHEIEQRLYKVPPAFDFFKYSDISSASGNFTEGEMQALFDIQFYLKDDLLVKVDRASMLYGLECRCPFLDPNLVKFAFSLHHSLKSHNGESKWLLKKLLSEFLPPHLVYRPKWGFSIPLGKWLAGDLKFMIDNYLNKQAVESVGLFNEQYVASVVKTFLGGRQYFYNRVWTLVIIHKWLMENDN
jgi:asparagine synthase (glutamine-hydrolysing)